MRPLFVVMGFALAACRPPASVPRDVPLDFAALPGPTGLSAEATLATRWETTLKAHQRAGEAVSFAGVDGVIVRGLIHRVNNPKAGVVILTGRTEPIEKCAELIDDLNNAGFSTYAMDHRGQGSSDRLLPNRDKGHVAYFEDYVTDLHTFITTIVKKDAPKNLFIVAHSLGGAVATLYADAHADQISGLALSAPMFEILTTGFPPSIASTLSLTACSATDGTAYALGSSDYKEEADFAKNSVSSSEARWQWKRLLVRDDPSLRLGGVTWHWLCESLTASSAIPPLGKYSPLPTLIMQAGNDLVVKPGGQDTYCAEAPRCQLTHFPDSKHELFHERDEIRNEAVSQVIKFINARSTP